MNDLHQILVATDLSEVSKAIYSQAAGLALGYGAEVTLLHVEEAPSALPTMPEVATYIRRLTAFHEAELEKAREWFFDQGIRARTETASGRASQQIIKTARRLEVGLVVIGKSGRRGLENLLFGTTTKRVLRKIKRPLLVVPKPPPTDDEALQPAVFNRLMTTTDFGEDSNRGLVWSLRLARELDVSLLLVHVLRPPATVAGEAFPEKWLEAARCQAESELETLAGRVGSQRLVTRLLVHDGIPQALALAVDQQEIDLIIVPSHGRGTFGSMVMGSVSEGLLRRANRPVLLLTHAYLEREFD